LAETEALETGPEDIFKRAAYKLDELKAGNHLSSLREFTNLNTSIFDRNQFIYWYGSIDRPQLKNSLLKSIPWV